MSERTGKTLTVPNAGLILHALTNGDYEVERDGVVLGKVAKYTSTSAVKPGKVRASASKPVTRWMATPKFVAGAFKRSSMGLRTARDAATALI